MSRAILPQIEDWDTQYQAFDWTVPKDFNIAERCCDSWAACDPDRIALTHLDDELTATHWSYGALKEASDRFAVHLRARNVGRGDRIAILMPQSPETLIAHFAAYKLGAIALPLFTLFGADALAYRLRDSGSCVVVTTPEKAQDLRALKGDLPELRHIYVTGTSGSFWDAVDKADPGDFIPEPVGAQDPAMIIYTSGTTGDPKGVLHAHRFLLGHLPSIEVSHPSIEHPSAVCWTPADWAWIGGLMDLAMPSLFYGARLVSHRMRKFSPQQAYDVIRREAANILFLPPTALKLMRASSVPQGLAIRSISSGGESLGPDLLAWGLSKLSAPITEIYGQTECNLVINAVPGRMMSPPGAMGRPVPGHHVQIHDGTGREVPPGQLGEICVRTGTAVMFLRYWNKPVATKAKFRGDWLRTGDLGVRDAAGYVRFSSRDDDVITSAGYRIGPTEIETALGSHPAIVMAAAIGVPDPVRTEAVKAFVVLKDDIIWSELLEAELIQHVRDRVSPHVAPRQIAPIDALPMTATGKILRRALRRQ